MYTLSKVDVLFGATTIVELDPELLNTLAAYAKGDTFELLIKSATLGLKSSVSDDLKPFLRSGTFLKYSLG